MLRFIRSEARKGDIVITLGAGNVTQISFDLVEELANFAPPTLEITPP